MHCNKTNSLHAKHNYFQFSFKYFSQLTPLSQLGPSLHLVLQYAVDLEWNMIIVHSVRFLWSQVVLNIHLRSLVVNIEIWGRLILNNKSTQDTLNILKVLLAHCLVDVESGSDRLVHYNLCDDADGEVWSHSLFAKIQKCLICVILNLAFSHVCN